MGKLTTLQPVNKFFQIYDGIRKQMDEYSDTSKKYWPFNYEHDCKIEECEPFNTFLHLLHGKVNDHTCIFLWQTYPTYMKGTSQVMQDHLLNESELRKDLHKWMNFTFSLVRLGRDYRYPTQTCWGMKLQHHKFAVFYRDPQTRKEEMVFSCDKKSELKCWWKSVIANNMDFFPFQL